jgi:hypothetical protein
MNSPLEHREVRLRGLHRPVTRADAQISPPAPLQPASRFTVSGENAGRQTATYSAPPSSGVL